MADITAWHGRNLSEHVSLRDAAAAQGYRFLSLSIYGSTSSPFYAAVMIKRPVVVAQRDWPTLTFDQFTATFNAQAALGYGPVIITATGSASNPLFAAVFEPQNPIPLTRTGLSSGDPKDVTTIQGMNAKAKTEGLILRWAASYGDASDPRFAAIWQPNPAKTFWTNDGLLDTAAQYQARFNAQASAWCRPSFVTIDSDQHYLSVFTNDQIGPWVARQDLSPDGYQNDFNTWTAQGYFPICVQAAGPDSTSARFAAIFAQSETVVPRSFHATGGTANAAIDAVVQQGMTGSPVHHAGLAIVHGTKLVYARGYTFAEPNWPLAQPTTHFRMASDSKFVTALAIFQLIEAGQLNLTDTLQSILQLKTPSGGPPSDPNFHNITIQHLLEHTSGLVADGFRNQAAVLTAFAQAGHPSNFPVSLEMTDAYMAGMNLLAPPGTSHYYNNCGYYMLGRVLAKKRNAALQEALQSHLFNPLGISRVRVAASLLTAQGTDEARYEGPSLLVGQSVMTPDRPPVPNEYGTESLEILSSAGGLTGAPTDLARLIAMVLDPNNTAAMKQATVQSMLSKGAAYLTFLTSTSAGAALLAAGLKLNNDGGARSGYGFDALSALSGGQFYGQKGGDLPETCNSVIQINGDWGFVMLWAGPPVAATSWYPDYPSVMNIAKGVDWGTTDLFPSFGMPSL